MFIFDKYDQRTDFVSKVTVAFAFALFIFVFFFNIFFGLPPTFLFSLSSHANGEDPWTLSRGGKRRRARQENKSDTNGAAAVGVR